jgi:hypothetical protein
MNAPGRVIQAIVCQIAGAPGPGGSSIACNLQKLGQQLERNRPSFSKITWVTTGFYRAPAFWVSIGSGLLTSSC